MLCSKDKQRSYHVQWTDCDYSRTAKKNRIDIITASNPAYNYDPNIVSCPFNCALRTKHTL